MVFPCFWGSFVIVCLCKGICACTIDSTAIAWLPFAARRQIHQLTRTSHACQLPHHWLIPRPPQTVTNAPTNRQTWKPPSNYRTSWPRCACPAGKIKWSLHNYSLISCICALNFLLCTHAGISVGMTTHYSSYGSPTVLSTILSLEQHIWPTHLKTTL